jgi:hypothetical protein
MLKENIMNQGKPKREKHLSTPVYVLVFLVSLGIGGFLMVHEHQAHIPGGVLLLGGFLLVCITMHLFMHAGGHGHSHSDKGE